MCSFSIRYLLSCFWVSFPPFFLMLIRALKYVSWMNCLSAWLSESVGKFQCCFNCLPVILHTIRYWIQRKEQGSNFQSSSHVLSSGTINLWSGHFSTLAAMAGAGTGAKSDRNHHGFVKSTSASSPAAPTGSCVPVWKSLEASRRCREANNPSCDALRTSSCNWSGCSRICGCYSWIDLMTEIS